MVSLTGLNRRQENISERGIRTSLVLLFIETKQKHFQITVAQIFPLVWEKASALSSTSKLK